MKTLSLCSASLFIILMAIYIAIGSESLLLVMAFFALVGLPGVAMLAFGLAKERHDDNR